MKKTDDEKVYVVKTSKFVDEETYLNIAEKRQQVLISKKKKKENKR